MSEINPYGECKDCRFFVSMDACVSQCRKCHPTGHGIGEFTWPLVKFYEGCGEWERLTDRQISEMADNE